MNYAILAKTVILLILSNVFMTFAWYGHLKNFNNKPLLFVILVSWGIAFFLNISCRYRRTASGITVWS